VHGSLGKFPFFFSFVSLCSAAHRCLLPTARSSRPLLLSPRRLFFWPYLFSKPAGLPCLLSHFLSSSIGQEKEMNRAEHPWSAGQIPSLRSTIFKSSPPRAASPPSLPPWPPLAIAVAPGAGDSRSRGSHCCRPKLGRRRRTPPP
jgi:hypothetical protein